MDQQLDALLAAHCSPALAGIKPANMVACTKEKFSDLHQKLSIYQDAFRPRNLHFEIICEYEKQFLLMVYNREQLETRVFSKESQYVLSEFGYTFDSGLEAVLAQLQQRMAKADGFPHEIGLFLGYPIEDVVGFIRNKGKACKLSGYWKVYGDAEKAARLFYQLSKVCNAVKTRIAAGESLLQVFAVA